MASTEAVTPSPAGSAATEDEASGNWSTSEAMSDNYPAGPALSAPQGAPGRQRLAAKFSLRFSAAELAALRARATALGVKPGAWLRAVALDALDERRGEVARLHRVAARRGDPMVALAVEQVRRVGVTLNQEVRRRNADPDSDPISDDLLHGVVATVDELRAALGDRTQL